MNDCCRTTSVFTGNESSDRKSEIIPRNLVNVICPEILRSLIDYFIIFDRHRQKILMNPLWCNFLEDIFQPLTDTELSEKVRYGTEVDRSAHFRFAQLFSANFWIQMRTNIFSSQIVSHNYICFKIWKIRFKLTRKKLLRACLLEFRSNCFISQDSAIFLQTNFGINVYLK